MVMSKVSKAIAASFLCLTINAGGATNAMNMAKPVPSSDSLSFNINMKNREELIKEKCESENKDEMLNNSEINVRSKVEIPAENEETKGGNNDDDKDKKTDIWKILIPVFTGVGGIIVGTLLGKFAF